MAGNWRIRHKLMLGMALVAAILGLLVAGTEKGLSSLRSTMRSFHSKLEEVKAVTALRTDIKALAAGNPNLQTQISDLQDKMVKVRKSFADYQAQLQRNLASRRDANFGFEEREQFKGLENAVVTLDKALDEVPESQGFNPGENPDLLKEGTPVSLAVAALVRSVDDLNDTIHSNLHKRIDHSRNESTVSLWIVGGTCVLAVFLMIGLLRFFYKWVAKPIRDLEQGVGRVARGDFEHKIEIHSGDEIEDLAKAFNDMTGRLHEMYGDLARQVNERSRQLVRSERLAGVGFLAAGVAHEINNPLASIAFCSEALERRLAELFDMRQIGSTAGGTAFRAGQSSTGQDLAQEREIVAKYLKMIQDEAFRCKEITQKLLAFSRGGERKREPSDMGELIQVVLDMVQHLPNHKGKDLVFEPAEVITAWVNGQEIKQVFLNLVVNALDSMEEGGKLTISQRTKGNTVEVVFQDTGCGMSAEVLENIFEPFFTRSRTGKGTGLGLSISHRIISQHGGEIEATTGGPNRGSTFTVRLPLEAPAIQQDDHSENLDPETEFVKLSGARRGRKAA